MKVRWDGKEYEVKAALKDRGTKALRRGWLERWLTLPMRWFEGATRDQFARLFINESEGIMVVSPETYEKMKKPDLTQAFSEASKS